MVCSPSIISINLTYVKLIVSNNCVDGVLFKKESALFHFKVYLYNAIQFFQFFLVTLPTKACPDTLLWEKVTDIWQLRPFCKTFYCGPLIEPIPV